MTENVKTLELSKREIENILCHILETLLVYEYHIELQAIDVFRQLSELASTNIQYEWFTDWSKKLIDMVKEKKMEG